jgi:hypothetical protein
VIKSHSQTTKYAVYLVNINEKLISHLLHSFNRYDSCLKWRLQNSIRQSFSPKVFNLPSSFLSLLSTLRSAVSNVDVMQRCINKSKQHAEEKKANVEIINFQRVPFIYFFKNLYRMHCLSFFILLFQQPCQAFGASLAEIVYGNCIQFDIVGTPVQVFTFLLFLCHTLSLTAEFRNNSNFIKYRSSIELRKPFCVAFGIPIH